METVDNFVILHRPCKVRVVSSFELRDSRKSYAPIGPPEMRLVLELDFELQGESDGQKLSDTETAARSIATD